MGRIVVFTVFRDDSRFHEHRRICFCVGTNHSPVAYSHVYTGMHTDTLSQEWIDPRSDIDQLQSIDQLEGRLRVSTAIPQKVRSNLTLLNRSRHPRIKDRKPRKNNKKKLDPSAQALAWARQVVVSGSSVGLGSGKQPKKTHRIVQTRPRSGVLGVLSAKPARKNERLRITAKPRGLSRLDVRVLCEVCTMVSTKGDALYLGERCSSRQISSSFVSAMRVAKSAK